MSLVTRCPNCGTSFLVAPEQLRAAIGQVRCGQCSSVFNALTELQSIGESTQIPQADAGPPVASAPHETEPEPLPGAETSAPASGQPELSPEAAGPETVASVAAPEHTEVQLPQHPAEPAPVAAPVQYAVPPLPRYRRLPLWVWSIGSVVLALLLPLQMLEFFHRDLAALFPRQRGLVAQYCALRGCRADTPPFEQLLTIESSDLRSDPLLPGVITLHVNLANRASVGAAYPRLNEAGLLRLFGIDPDRGLPQAYPNLQLTLTDIGDQPLARRDLLPADYLPATADAESFPPHSEIAISVALDASALAPVGYKLLQYQAQR